MSIIISSSKAISCWPVVWDFHCQALRFESLFWHIAGRRSFWLSIAKNFYSDNFVDYLYSPLQKRKNTVPDVFIKSVEPIVKKKWQWSTACLNSWCNDKWCLRLAFWSKIIEKKNNFDVFLKRLILFQRKRILICFWGRKKCLQWKLAS